MPFLRPWLLVPAQTPSSQAIAPHHHHEMARYTPGRNDRNPWGKLIRMVSDQPVRGREEHLITWGDGSFLGDARGCSEPHKTMRGVCVRVCVRVTLGVRCLCICEE